MSKIFILTLACTLCVSAAARVTQSESERLLKQHGGKIPGFNREELIRNVNETMLIIEDLCRQIKLAPKAEVDDIWIAGKRDYQLEKAPIRDSRKACEAVLQALDLEANPSRDNSAKAADLREDARDLIRPHHKKQTEEYIRDLRNWLTISEGILRHANEKRERELKK